MSINLMSAAFKANLPDVVIPVSALGAEHTVKASTLKFVLLALADHANDEGRGAYPALDTLAKKTSMSRRTVQRALDALIKLEIIKCVGVSEYGTDNYTIYETAIYRGDSGTHATDGVTLGQAGDDSGAIKSVPESPKSSFKPSIKPFIKQPTEIPFSQEEKDAPALHIFTDTMGNFKSLSELKRWLILVELIGNQRAGEIVAWAKKKEIDMVNRSGLLDTLETAAKKWLEPKTHAVSNKPQSAYAQLLAMTPEEINGS